jgi:hypothetical protein
MANCHDLFQTFLDRISPSSTKLEYLKGSRDAIRNKIRKHFKEVLKMSTPKFWGQGSYKTKTLIVPLNGEYDIDDGVYLTCLDKDKEKWETPEKVHEWICDAVKNHTDQIVVDKDTCVRVVYAKQYHVDLPIYGDDSDEYCLAEKGAKGWHPSNPRAIVEWFKDQTQKKGDQLKRIVKYVKAWADFKSDRGKMPSSLMLTVLACQHYEVFDNDDACFSKTVKNMYSSLSSNFEIKNPVDEKEVLSNRLTSTQKDIFLLLLQEALNNAAQALKEDSKKISSEKWREVFGDRFPIGDDEKGKIYTSGPAILKNDARSA